MTKEQREELKNGIMPLLNTICSMRGLGFDDVEKELLDFIESEVEKAKKEGVRFNNDEISRIHHLINENAFKDEADRQLDLQIVYKLSELRDD